MFVNGLSSFKSKVFFGAQPIFKTERSQGKKTIDLKLEIHIQTRIKEPK